MGCVLGYASLSPAEITPGDATHSVLCLTENFHIRFVTQAHLGPSPMGWSAPNRDEIPVLLGTPGIGSLPFPSSGSLARVMGSFLLGECATLYCGRKGQCLTLATSFLTNSGISMAEGSRQL